MRELYAYVWRSSAPQQIVLIILAIIAAVLATAPLELQRHIINTLAGHEKAERQAGDLVVDNIRGGGDVGSSFGSQVARAFETIYAVRLRVFKLKFGLKF